MSLECNKFRFHFLEVSEGFFSFLSTCHLRMVESVDEEPTDVQG